MLEWWTVKVYMIRSRMLVIDYQKSIWIVLLLVKVVYNGVGVDQQMLSILDYVSDVLK